MVGPGRDSLAKRMTAGDTETEAIRAHRRRISDEVFRRLELDEGARLIALQHRTTVAA